VINANNLDPEKSVNANLNYIKKIYFDSGAFLWLETTAFCNCFNNKIIPDYEVYPNKIFFDTTYGYSLSQGISCNAGLNFTNGLKFIIVPTYIDVSNVENCEKMRPLSTKECTGTRIISCKINPINLAID